MAEENLGEIYVKIRADQTKFEQELRDLKRKIDKESKGNPLVFKARFDAAVAKLKIDELLKLQKKLQVEFDKKIKLNVDAASLDRTRQKIASVQSALSGVGEGAKPLPGMFSTIGASIGAAFATATIVRFGFEAVSLAGKVEGVKIAFDNLNQPGLLQNLRDATRNTVSDFELMKLAMRASNFKIPLTELGTLLEFAEKRASQTGQEVDYLVNSIIDGIGRKSTLVLDNLGISATELQSEFAKTGDFGKATANIIEREMKKMGDVVETSATKVAQLTAQIENQKAELGKQLLPVWNGFLKVLGGGMSFLSGLGQEFKRTVSPARYYGEIIAELTLKHNEYAKMLEKTYKAQVKISSFIVSTYKQQADTIGRTKEKIDELVLAQDNLVYGSDAYLKNVKEIEKLEKSIGLGKEDKEIEKPKEFKPQDIKAKFIGMDEGLNKDVMYEHANNDVTLAKLKYGELQLFMQETNQVMLDNSMFTTEAIMLDWLDKNALIKESIDSMTAFTDGFFNQIRVQGEWANSMLEQGFATMADAFIAQVKRMAAEWLWFQFLRGVFSVATGGAAAAVPVAHNGGNFIGTSSGVKKMAGGGSFIVPPGFPNDSYPLLVESGERVTVNPTSQTGMESRLLRSIDRKLAVLNSNTVEGQVNRSKQGAIPLYGKLEGQDIYISNKRAAKQIGRMS